jgi:MFS family permease
VCGAVLGAATTALGVPLVWHLVAVAVFIAVLAQATTGWFLPRGAEARALRDEDQRSSLAAWLEPRTLLIGVMVLSLALTEGTANDWLAVALIDGYDTPRWLGIVGFALFVTAMTAGRLVGPVVLDRYGRVPVLWATMAAAGVGVVLIVVGELPVLVVVGIVLWGLGASLGFPVGMSAAADDPVHAASRVSVVSTIAYTAFLAGPPLLGFLADHVGTLNALLAVSILLIPSALVVPAAREPRDVTRGGRRGDRG